MKALHLSYDHSEGLTASIQKWAGGTAYRFLHFITQTNWAFSMAVLFIIGLPATILFYFPLQIMRKKLSKLADDSISNLSKLNVRDAMLFHAGMDREIFSGEQLATKMENFYVFKPLHSEILLMISDLKRAEKAYSDYVYPDSDVELTSEQMAELEEAYQPWKELDQSRLLEHA